MKILLTNYRYFVSGGPERYLFNVKSLVEKAGDQVIPFSISNNQNVPNEYSSYFLSPIGDGSQVYFKEIEKSPSNLIKLLGRSFYSFEAKRKLERLLDRHPVNIAYILYFLRWISPSILDVFQARGIPVVVRVSDFSYLCPQAHFLRNGQVCELCKNGSFLPSIKYKCVQGSFLASVVNAAARKLHSYRGIWSKVDAIICPSRFMLEKMIEGGFPQKKLHHVPTFVDIEQFDPCYETGDYFLYFGRVAHEKGIATLLEAFSRFTKNSLTPGPSLKIVGRSNDGERDRLEEVVKEQQIPGVYFIDEQDLPSLKETIRKSLCVIVPSIWYDNMPNVVLESFASGKPVIASDLGSLPELVVEGKTGLLFSPGNPDHLAECLCAIVENPDQTSAMGRESRRAAETLYSPSAHSAKLRGIFTKLTHR